MNRRGTVRRQRESLAAEMRAAGGSWVEIASAVRSRWPELSVLATLRIAHGWTQQRAADEWTKRWPDQPRAAKEISLWENWPGGSGRRPSFTTLDQLAQLYHCSVSDLLADISDYRHLDPASDEVPAATYAQLPVPIRGGDPAAGRKTDRLRPMVPPIEPDIVERTDELDRIVEALLDGSVEAGPKVVALSGPGGFGKSTLAIQACHHHQTRAAFDQILWVEVGEQAPDGRVVELIAALCVHLGTSPPALSDAEQAGLHLAKVISGRRALLVIDNVWSAQHLDAFLLSADAVVLVTTRNRRTCPAHARVLDVGLMEVHQIGRMLQRGLTADRADLTDLAERCSGWPLLARVLSAALHQDIESGASPQRALERVRELIDQGGLAAFDVWDTDERTAAIGHVVASSLRNLEQQVTIPGCRDISDRYLSLCVFPASTEIPLATLRRWWATAYDWPPAAVDQFCRLLADRSLLGTYHAGRGVVALHDVFRNYLRHLVGPTWPDLHRSLLDAHRPASGRGWIDLEADNNYLWQHLAHHLSEAGLLDELWTVFSSPSYLIEKTTRCGIESLASDHQIIEATQSAPVATGLAAVRDTTRGLTGSAYLLDGLTRRADMAVTLQLCLDQTSNSTDEDALASLVQAETDRFEMTWSIPGHHHSFSLDSAASDDARHVGAVTCVAASDQYVASGGEDGAVRLWDRTSGDLVGMHRGHIGWVYALALRDNGETIASAGDDGAIRVWRSDTRSVDLLVGHDSRVRAIAFASEQLLISGGDDGIVKVWDLNNHGPAVHAIPLGAPVWALAVPGDGVLAVAAGGDQRIWLCELTTGQVIDVTTGHHDWVRSVSFASDGARLTSGSADQTLRSWEIVNGAIRDLETTASVPGRIRSTATGPGGDVIAAGEDGLLQAHRQSGEIVAASVPDEIDWIRAVAITPDEQVIAGCEDGSLRTWDYQNHGPLVTFTPAANSTWSADHATAFGVALFGHSDGTIDARDPGTGTIRSALTAGPGRVWSLASSQHSIAAACGDGTVRLWNDLTTGAAPVLEVNRDQRRTWAVALDAAGSRLAASDSRGTVRIWDVATGEQLGQIQAHPGRVRTIHLDPSGQTLVTGGGDGTVRLWDVPSETIVGEFVCPSGWVRAVTLGPEREVIAGSGHGEIVVFEPGNDTPAALLKGHNGRVLLVAHLGPGHLISAAGDGTIRAWDTESAGQTAAVRVAASLHCAAVDPATGSVVAASAAGLAAVRFRSPRPTARIAP